MAQYKGISKKKMKDGSIAIMVRFKHLGITYPVKNFTRLYGSKTEKDAFEKLCEVKSLLSKNKDPFATSLGTLNDIFKSKIELSEKNRVWTKATIKNYKYFFNKHISPVIGKKSIGKITYEEIMKILNSFSHIQSSAKNKVIDILRPIFKEEHKKGNIFENIMLKVDKYTVKIQREDLSKRTNYNNTEIVRKLYNAISTYNQAHSSNLEQHKMFLYMLLLTAHRYGELNQLEKKHCDLENKKIVSPKEITKTKMDYHFPIPEECFDYIKNHPGGKLFNVPRGGTASRIFHRLLINAKIETIDNHNISMHDTRKLMLSIMISNLGIDSRLADYCLDHKPQGTIKHYLEFSYEDKVIAYKKYWNYVKNVNVNVNSGIGINELKPKNNILNNDSNFDKLKELVEMYENGYLTKNQFELERNKLF